MPTLSPRRFDVQSYSTRLLSDLRPFLPLQTNQTSAPALFAAAGLTPDPWQRSVLESTADRLLLLCCRQGGKSTVTAALALQVALAEPGSLVLLLARAQRQAAELLRKVMDFYSAAGRPVVTEHEGALAVELANRSRIVSLPGKEDTIRGYSGVRLLVIDEASRVPDLLYGAVRPMLAVSGGRLVGLSTPWGKRGWFYEAWHGAGEWARFSVKASECPRIPPAFLAEERRTLPDWFFRQEYELAFVDAIDSLFRSEDIEAALEDPEVTPLWQE